MKNGPRDELIEISLHCMTASRDGPSARAAENGNGLVCPVPTVADRKSLTLLLRTVVQLHILREEIAFAYLYLLIDNMKLIYR